MTTPTSETLVKSRCLPCEGGVPKLTAEQASQYIGATPAWQLDSESNQIHRQVNCGNFVKAVELINKIAEIAEADQHHPDLHLTGYRHLNIVLTTHAISGLSENDFILAAKIDKALE